MKRLLVVPAIAASLFFATSTGASAKATASCTETEPGVVTCTATKGRETCTAVFVNGELVSSECKKAVPGKP